MSTGQIRMDFDTLGGPSEAKSRNGARAVEPRRGLTREDVMTASEVGALLRLASSSVYELARRGVIPGHRVGRAWRFIRQEIEECIRAS